MASRIRSELNTPLPMGGPTGHQTVACNHEVQFYSDDTFLLDSVAFFLNTSLERTGSTIVVGTESHRAGIAQRLKARGISLSAAVQQGRYLALDAQETLDAFMKAGKPDPFLFAETIGKAISCAQTASQDANGKVAVFGEMVSLLWQEGNIEAAIELERLWNDLARTQNFSLRCGYPLATFNRSEHEAAFAKICDEHTHVIPAESYSGITDDKARLFSVVRLQQIEQVLKTEAAERAQAQARTEEVQTQNQELRTEIKKREAAEDELRRFARRLLVVRDEEQRHIASELHENTAQLIAALSMYFGVLQEERENLSPRAAEAVARSRMVAQNLLREVRKLSYLLHPLTLDDVGLRPALTEFIQQFAESGKATVSLEVAENFGRLPRRMEIAIFRMIEEALNNIGYSRKGSAVVRLAREQYEVRLEIETRTGTPMQEDPFTGRGVVGIAERAKELGGAVNIRTDNKGTIIAITLPTRPYAQA